VDRGLKRKQESVRGGENKEKERGRKNAKGKRRKRAKEKEKEDRQGIKSTSQKVIVAREN